jgi:hypothetical protein
MTEENKSTDPTDLLGLAARMAQLEAQLCTLAPVIREQETRAMVAEGYASGDFKQPQIAPMPELPPPCRQCDGKELGPESLYCAECRVLAVDGAKAKLGAYHRWAEAQGLYGEPNAGQTAAGLAEGHAAGAIRQAPIGAAPARGLAATYWGAANASWETSKAFVRAAELADKLDAAWSPDWLRSAEVGGLLDELAATLRGADGGPGHCFEAIDRLAAEHSAAKRLAVASLCEAIALIRPDGPDMPF